MFGIACIRDKPETSLGNFLLARIRTNADESDLPAQIHSWDGQHLSYPELLEQSVRAAAGWRALGLRRGDHVGVFSWHQHQLLPAILGALYEGITVVLFVPFATSVELRHYLSTAGVAAVLTEASLLNILAAETKPDTVLVVLGEAESNADVPKHGKKSMSLDEFLRGGDQQGLSPATYQAADISDIAEHIAVITFSSGTSGLPKAVAYTNMGLELLVRNVWRYLPEERVLMTHPMSWSTGLVTALTCAASGTTTVLHNYKDERSLLNVIDTFKVTSWLTAPARLALLAQLVKDLRDQNRHSGSLSLLYITTVGAPLAADAQRFISDTLNVPIRNLYGTTETSHITGYEPSTPDRSSVFTPGTVGKPLPNVSVRLVDCDTGRELTGPNEAGEVRAKTPWIMRGYVNNPQAQAEAFDEQGFYRTGDVGLFNEKGELFIVDRIKELITYDEFDVAPAEVEAVLASHPAVKEACVVGRTHPRLNELPTAFVVRKQGASVAAEELKDLVKARLADHKRVRGGVFFVGEIPKSANGKVLRRKLKQECNSLPILQDEDLLL